MRTIGFILQKEFIQIFRNRAMLPIIFVMPVIQLLILSNAATFTIRNITVYVVDRDQTGLSKRLVEKFPATGYFQLVGAGFSDEEAADHLKRNRANMILQIPHRFGGDLSSGRPVKVQFIINAEDGNAAGLTQAYAGTIVAEFGRAVAEESGGTDAGGPSIATDYSYWYNPELDYKVYMIPGILVALVSMIGLFLSGMNIVREKEIGTIEQLNVTPIRRYQFIVGKLLPFWILGIVELAVGLVIARLIFAQPVVGQFWLIFLVSAVYILVVLGVGLFISTVTHTQQQAMFIAWFFMVIFMLLGGIFTPIESMPRWAQQITRLNPIAYFVEFMRMVLLKGSTFSDVASMLLILSVFAALAITLSVLRYRKVTA